MQKPPHKVDAMFVQSAASATYEDGSLTLHGLMGATVYFADHPQREVGHIATSRFVEFWDEGEASFADQPPVAVLSFLDALEAKDDVSLVLKGVQLVDDELTYQVGVVDGTLPDESGPCSLFIDVFDRPLTPASTHGSND